MLRRGGRWIVRILLGLFVLWQLVFLAGLNFCEVARHYLGTFAEFTKSIPTLADEPSLARQRLAKFEQVLTRWSELTNQTQSWSLFAPDVWSNIPFVAVEFRWDEEPANACAAAGLLGTLAAGDPVLALGWCAMPPPRPPVYFLSDNEPPDIYHYFRLGLFRLRRYESNLDVSLFIEHDKSKEDMQDKWRQWIFDRVRGNPNGIRTYLEWRWRTYRSAHPDAELPKQVIMHVRVYRVPPPPGPRPWTWDGPDESPVARWRPHTEYAPEVPRVEVYDLVAKRFDTLP